MVSFYFEGVVGKVGGNLEWRGFQQNNYFKVQLSFMGGIFDFFQNNFDV